jgi:hypothetical protein
MASVCSLIAPELRESFAPSRGNSALDDFSFAGSLLYNEIALFVKRKPAEVIKLMEDEKDSN